MVYLRHVHQQLWVVIIAPERLSCRLQALLPRLEHMHHAARLLLIQAAQLQQQQHIEQVHKRWISRLLCLPVLARQWFKLGPSSFIKADLTTPPPGTIRTLQNVSFPR